jgi:hypothetical protein
MKHAIYGYMFAHILEVLDATMLYCKLCSCCLDILNIKQWVFSTLVSRGMHVVCSAAPSL